MDHWICVKLQQDFNKVNFHSILKNLNELVGMKHFEKLLLSSKLRTIKFTFLSIQLNKFWQIYAVMKPPLK